MTQQTYPMMARILAQDTGPTRVDVFDDIGEGGWFGGLSAKSFASQLSGVKGALEVHINSGGGDVFDGIAIGNAIRAHKGPVTTVVDGLAASIASVIAQAGQDRVVEPGAMLMIHKAFGACMGNDDEMEKMAQTLRQVSGNLAEIYASRAGGTAEQWLDAMAEETWYTADEAVAAGLADRVGEADAELPAGLDIAAFEHIPGRIAARLRKMPQAKAPAIADADGNHAPMTGSHAHGHPAYGSQGGDGSHNHDHAHDGDAAHNHGHGGTQDHRSVTAIARLLRENGAGAGADCDALAAEIAALIRGDAGACCPDCGPDCACAAPSARLRNAAPMHGDHERIDPDGDGDCDACPGGDTDNDYWDEEGNQIQPVPGGTGNAAGQSFTAELRSSGLQAVIREAVAYVLADAGGIDNSDWDASRAWHNGATSDDPAAFYKGICAGQKSGDKTTQDAWALPYKYTPGSPPNANGVRNALARLDQTQGLTNHDEAKALLQRLMKKVNPDYDPDASDDTDLSGIDLEEIRAALKGANE